MSLKLKIKSKHLSLEAKVIRFEERKLLKQLRSNIEHHVSQAHNSEYDYFNDHSYRSYYSLNKHRRYNVRNENRATFLARAYLAGKPYSSVETSRKHDKEYTFTYIILPRVISMVKKYRPKVEFDVDTSAEIKAWVLT